MPGWEFMRMRLITYLLAVLLLGCSASQLGSDSSKKDKGGCFFRKPGECASSGSQSGSRARRDQAKQARDR